jgi:membrane protease YdiL (CAAX protease family)
MQGPDPTSAANHPTFHAPVEGETPAHAPTEPTRRPPDAGSRPFGFVAWALLILFTGAVIFLNQCEAPSARAEAKAEKAAAQEATPITAPDVSDQFAMSARLMVKIVKGLGMESPDFGRQIADTAFTNVDRFRAALAVAEVNKTEAAVTALDTLDSKISEDTNPKHLAKHKQLATDITLARKVYSESPDVLSPEERAGLVERHGYFGKLLLTHGKPDSAPEREGLISGGLGIFAGIGVMVIAVIVAFFGFVAAIIILFLNINRIRAAFVPATPGGSVYVETAAVFAISFLLLKTCSDPIISAMKLSDETAMAVHLGAQWLLLPVIFWPLLRGVSFAQFRQDVGWHSGKGVLREMGAGFLGYCAGLPLLILAMVASMVIVMVKTRLATAPGEAPAGPENPILEIITRVGPGTALLLFLLATVWAPIVEETIFRGCLYRAVRLPGRLLMVLIASVITALFFGVMHGYEFLLLGPVIAIGFIFAVMREWRGSLIGSITMHAVHNATVMSIVFLILGSLRD